MSELLDAEELLTEWEFAVGKSLHLVIKQKQMGMSEQMNSLMLFYRGELVVGKSKVIMLGNGAITSSLICFPFSCIVFS